MNVYVVDRATQGFANYINKAFPGRNDLSVVAGHDCRNNSRLFAETVANIFCANGIKAYLFESLRPTPEISFAIIDHNSSKPNCKYRPDVIHYDYDKDKTCFYDSRPNRFFLFFPCDWHIAKIATDDVDQTIRVIVVKLDYVK